MSIFPQQPVYSYRDYKSWSSEDKWELIEGVPFAMTPAPSTKHQRISSNLHLIIGNYLKGKDCMVFYSPYDVLLQEKDEPEDMVKTVVQPDLLVICDKSKIKEKHCLGAPDWIIEIVSQSTVSLDYVKKLSLYEKHQVREYWIIDPNDQQVMVYELGENGYEKPVIYKANDLILVGIFELFINLQEVFQ